MTPGERALMHAQERHDAEIGQHSHTERVPDCFRCDLSADEALFSHVEHEQPIRADVDMTPAFAAGPVTWMDEGDDEPDDGWDQP